MEKFAKEKADSLKLAVNEYNYVRRTALNRKQIFSHKVYLVFRLSIQHFTSRTYSLNSVIINDIYQSAKHRSRPESIKPEDVLLQKGPRNTIVIRDDIINRKVIHKQQKESR